MLISQGIYVTRVEPFTPADMAGIKVHDRLLSINNYPVVKVPHSAVVDALQAAGRDVAIKVERVKPSSSIFQKVGMEGYAHAHYKGQRFSHSRKKL